jgi:hypothetical protein
VSTETPLAAGKKGNAITVTATINADVTGSLKNVAYVSPRRRGWHGDDSVSSFRT